MDPEQGPSGLQQRIKKPRLDTEKFIVSDMTSEELYALLQEAEEMTSDEEEMENEEEEDDLEIPLIDIEAQIPVPQQPGTVVTHVSLSAEPPSDSILLDLGAGTSTFSRPEPTQVEYQPVPSSSLPSPSLPSSIPSTDPRTFSWSSSPPADLPNFPFTGQAGLRQFPHGSEPIDYFNLMFTDTFFRFLVQETNSFAEEIFLRGPSPRARITDWKDVSVDEMKLFLGLTFHMGIIKLNRVADYWNTNEKFNFKFFSSRMSRDRYLGIREAFHLTRNPEASDPPPDNPLKKILPLVEYFNEKMQEVIEPGKNVAIDESMSPWRGRVSFRQYLPLKSHKYGIKLYMLAEQDGLVHRFIIYAGARDLELAGTGHVNKVVHKLLDGLKFMGRSVFMDNFYNSVDLSSELLSQKTYTTGTLRSSRKNIPREVIDKKLRRGEVIERWSDEGINVCKWRDKRDVLSISSEFSGKLVSIETRREVKNKPEAILQYNKYMGGIDRIDQYLSYYKFNHKSLKWYKKLSFHIFEILLLNSYFLYKRYSGNKNLELYAFRLQIIDALCKSTKPSPAPPRSPKYINYAHLPDYLPRVSSGKKRRQKKCRVCYKTTKLEVSTYCPACEGEPGLCLGSCFEKYHRNNGFSAI